ncbi:MAG: hypothetical protein OEV28_03105, partial [Nitrospirota bacterium]|nr:hypothetical protein [Nitrospirota bacterium]
IDNLPDIAPMIAEGLWRRHERQAPSVNIIASENLPGTGAYLRHQIVSGISADKAAVLKKCAGFSAALTHRIMTGGEVRDGVLHFTVDIPGDLLIDSRGLVEPFPEICHATISRDFDALFLAKLSTINLAQAVAAYIGHQYGCTYIHEAARHPEILPVIKGALEEASNAFRAEFPDLDIAIVQDAQEALLRIEDAGLQDMITRVAKGPQRKLTSQERLLGPARLAARHNLPYENLARTIGAALAYENEQDLQSRTMQYVISNDGVDRVLTDVSGLLPHEPLAQCIKRHWAVHRGKLEHAVISAHEELLADVIRDVSKQLCEEYESEVVMGALAEVALEFRDARISSFLETLVIKRATERIRERSRILRSREKKGSAAAVPVPSTASIAKTSPGTSPVLPKSRWISRVTGML